MKTLIRHLLRKTRTEGYAQRDETVEGDPITFGRGTDCTVHMADPRVLLHHAQLVDHPGGLFLEALGQVDIQVDGRHVTSAPVAPGVTAQIGPYDLAFIDPPEGSEARAAFTLELARPMGDVRQQLAARSQTVLTRAGLSARGWAWIAVSLVLLVGLAAPLGAYFGKAVSGAAPEAARAAALAEAASVPAQGGLRMSPARERSLIESADRIWLPGEMSGVHAFFGTACESCHTKPFQKVRNETCVACHKESGQHADPVEFPDSTLAGQRCASCHKEHEGGARPVFAGQGFCTDCHARPEETAPGVELAAVTGFDAHPEFRLPETDPSALKFPHAKHMVDKGLRDQTGTTQVLACGDCHRADSGGAAMLPVTFETDCAGCHSLAFAPEWPDREMPHARTEAAKQTVADVYAALALRGQWVPENAPEDSVIARRRPGETLQEEERIQLVAWAAAKAEEAIAGPYVKGVCGNCHVLDEGEGGVAWSVVDPNLPEVWLARAGFDHGAHGDAACETCHAARESDSARDVVLPQVDVCTDCHGDPGTAGKTPSPCTSCHGFHRDDLPAMTLKQAHSGLGDGPLFAAHPEPRAQ